MTYLKIKMDFKQKVEKLIGKLWDRPEDMSLSNAIRKEDLDNYSDIERFLNNHNSIYELTSPEFQSQIEQLQESKKKNKMKFLLEKKIGFENWKVYINENEIKAEKDNSAVEYYGYINESGLVQWANYFVIPYVIREAVDDYFVEKVLNEETTTADMAVMDTQITNKRDDIVDVYDGVEECEAKVTPEKFYESVIALKNKKFYLISENFENAKNNLESLVECEGKLHRILIPKNAFKEFLKDNSLTEGYLKDNGELLLEDFMSHRTFSLKSLYLKEFVENEISATDLEDLEVLDVSTDTNGTDVIINYQTKNGSYNNIVTELVPLIDFILDEDVEASKYKIELSDGSELFNEEAYFNSGNNVKEIVKRYLIEQNKL